MRKAIILTFSIATVFSTMAAGSPVTQLKSISVQFPDSTTMFPPGPGVQAADNNCLSCHSAAMVLNQASFPRATWQREVDKMRQVYKAPISDDEAASIVTYLSSTKGRSASVETLAKKTKHR
jgi:hypothetical protein